MQQKNLPTDEDLTLKLQRMKTLEKKFLDKSKKGGKHLQ